MKNRRKNAPIHAASRLLLLMLALCLLLCACCTTKDQASPPPVTDPTQNEQKPGKQDPPPSSDNNEQGNTQAPPPSSEDDTSNVTPTPNPIVNRVGNIRSICVSDRYQDKDCESVIVSIYTQPYQSYDLCQLYLSQADDQLIGVRAMGQDITPTKSEDGLTVYCLDMQALNMDASGEGYTRKDLWVQLFFAPDSLKENQAYPLMVEKHYEGGFYKKEEQHVFGDRGLLEYFQNRVSSARVYASLSQLYEQTDVTDLHLPASAAWTQIEYRKSDEWLQYDMSHEQGTIYITKADKGKLQKEMDRYTDHYSKREIYEKDGMTYYIIGHWATCGAPAVPSDFLIYWQIGTRRYEWNTFNVNSFEEAIALVEDLQTFSK